MERGEEEDATFVDRGEEFLGVEEQQELRRATLVVPKTSDLTQQSALTSAGVGADTGPLSIQTSWDAHNVTRSSMVTSSGYGSSASTDVSFSSPFVSPDMESAPFFAAEGAQGVSSGSGGERALAESSVDNASEEEGEEDEEISSEDEVSVHDEDYNLAELSSSSGVRTTKTASDRSGRGRSGGGRGVTGPSRKAGEASTQEDAEPNVFVDRWESCIAPEVLPKPSTIVVTRRVSGEGSDGETLRSSVTVSREESGVQGLDYTIHTDSFSTKLSAFSTSVNTGQETAGDVIGRPDTRSAMSVYAEVPSSTDALGPAPSPQTVEVSRPAQAVTVDDVLRQFPGEEANMGEPPRPGSLGKDGRKQDAKRDSSTADAAEGDELDDLPHVASKTRFSARLKSSTLHEANGTKRSTSETQHGEERYTSTLYIARGEPRNAHTKPEETEPDSERRDAETDSDSVSPGSASRSTISFLTKPCSATFDVGRLRSPTPIQLTGGQWGQVSQIITPDHQDSGCVLIDSGLRHAASQPAGDLVVGERHELSAAGGAYTLVTHTEEWRESQWRASTEEGDLTQRAGEGYTTGGNQTHGAGGDTQTAGEGGEEEEEEGGRRRQHASVLGAGQVSQSATIHRSCLLFSPADQDPGKLCYFAHVLDDENADDDVDDDDGDGRAVNCLDIFIQDYNKRGDLVEQTSLSRSDRTVVERDSEAYKVLVQRDDSSRTTYHVVCEDLFTKQRQDQHKADSEDKDKPGGPTDPEEHARYSQHLNLLFDYSSDVNYLDQDDVGSKTSLKATEKYGVLEFRIQPQPAKTVLSTWDASAVVGGRRDMEVAQEDRALEPGESTPHIHETEARSDESSSVTTTIENVQDDDDDDDDEEEEEEDNDNEGADKTEDNVAEPRLPDQEDSEDVQPAERAGTARKATDTIQGELRDTVLNVLAELDAATAMDEDQEESEDQKASSSSSDQVMAAETTVLTTNLDTGDQVSRVGDGAFASYDVMSDLDDGAMFVDRREETLDVVHKPTVHRLPGEPSPWSDQRQVPAEEDSPEVTKGQSDDRGPDEQDGGFPPQQVWGYASGDQHISEAAEIWSPGIPEQQAPEVSTFTTEGRQRYELAVQSVVTRLQLVQTTLTQISVQSFTSDLDQRMEQYEETIQELESLQKEAGQLVVELRRLEKAQEEEEEEEEEGRGRERWAQALLTPLVELQDQLQALADDKGKELQEAAVQKNDHERALAEYMRQVCDMQTWAAEMLSGLTYITDTSSLQVVLQPGPSSVSLTQRLHDNKAQQVEAFFRLQLLADLDSQCLQLHRLEPPSEAEKMISHSSNLTSSIHNIQRLLSQEENILLTAIEQEEKKEEGEVREGGERVEEEKGKSKKEEEEEEEEEEERWSSEEEGERNAKVEEKEEEEKKEEEERIDQDEEGKERSRMDQEERRTTGEEEENDDEEEEDDEEDEEDKENDDEEWSTEEDEVEEEEEEDKAKMETTSKVHDGDDDYDQVGTEADYVQRTIPATDVLQKDNRESTISTSAVVEGKTTEYVAGKSTEAATDTLKETSPEDVLERTTQRAIDDGETKTVEYLEGRAVERAAGALTEVTEDVEGKDVEGKAVERVEGGGVVEDREGKTVERSADVIADASQGGVLQRPTDHVTTTTTTTHVGEISTVDYVEREEEEEVELTAPGEEVEEGGGDLPVVVGQTMMVTTVLDDDAVWRTVTVTDGFDPSTVTLADQIQQQQALATEVRDHQKLVQQLATTRWTEGSATLLQPSAQLTPPPPSPPSRPAEVETRGREMPASPGSSCVVVVVPLSAGVLRTRWEKAHKDLVEKKEELEEVLPRRQAGETVTEQCSLLIDSSQLLIDIGSSVAQVSDVGQQVQLQSDNEELQQNTVLLLQYQMLKTVAVMSTWMTSAQQILLMPSRTTQHADDRLRQVETLQRELQQAQGHITLLSSQAESLAPPLSHPDTQLLVLGSLTSLRQWGSSLELEAVRQYGALQQEVKLRQQLQLEVRELHRHLLEMRSSVKAGGTTPTPTTTTTACVVRSVASLATDVTKWETQVQECETRLAELRRRQIELTTHHYYPESVTDSELRCVSELFVIVQKEVAEQRALLEQLRSSKQQYENMLKELGDFVDVGQAKVTTGPVPAQDLPHLQRRLQADKEFFSHLQDHRRGLDAAASLCDAATRQEHAAQHGQLCLLTQGLDQRAGLQCQCLESLVLQWGQFQSLVDEVHTGFLQVETDVGDIEEDNELSLASLKNRTHTVTFLQQQLQHVRHQIFQAVHQGRQLQSSVACPTLDATLTDMTEKWGRLDRLLQVELKKIQTQTRQLKSLEADSKALKSWMTSSHKRLEDVADVSQDVDTVDLDHLHTQAQTVLELRKETQNQQPLRSSVASTGRALTAHVQDSTQETAQDIDQRVIAVEEEWEQLQKSIGVAERRAHEAQVKHLPPLKMIAELQVFLGTLEKALVKDADTPFTAVSDVQVLVKKCRVYKVELSTKQLIMDAVKASLDLTGPDPPPLSQDMQKHADTVAQLDCRWTKVSAGVDDRLQALERLSDQWSSLDTAVTERRTCMSQEGGRLTACGHPAPHEAAVRLALQECKTIQAQHQRHQAKDLQQVQALGENVMRLIGGEGGGGGGQRHAKGHQSVRKTLSTLRQQREQLQRQLPKTVDLLESLLGRWTRYQALRHTLTQSLDQAQHALDRCSSSTVGPDVQALGYQVDRLKRAQQDLIAHRSDLKSLTAQAATLREKCDGEEPSDEEQDDDTDLQSTASALRNRWDTLTANLAKRLQQLEGCLGSWQKYEAQRAETEALVEAKEGECVVLIGERADTYPGEEVLRRCEVLQQELEEAQNKVNALDPHSRQDLSQHMEPSTIALLVPRHSRLKQRLQAPRQRLSEHAQDLQRELSLLAQFREASAALHKFLEQAGEVLAVEDRNATSAEEAQLEERVAQLRGLLAQFQDNVDKLNVVNDLGHRLALDPKDSSRLLDLNHLWHQRLADCQGRCRALQASLVTLQSFSAKCRSWLEVLSAVQDLLASPIARDLPGLLDQQKQCQDFEGELLSHQQVLDALLAEGRRMLEGGGVGEDPAGFHGRLQAMAQRWQSVVTRAWQRKVLIDDLVDRWRGFNAESERLSTWLQEKREVLKGLQQVERLSLQQLASFEDDLKTVQRELGQQQGNRLKVQDLADVMQLRADSCDVEEVKLTAERLQVEWDQVQDQAEDQRQRLQALGTRWARTEEVLEEVQGLVKERRDSLGKTGLPETYDDLQDALREHQEFSAGVLRPARQLEELKAQEASLKDSVHEEDMDVLHQRIQMAIKLWHDLIWLAERREERLKEALSRWDDLESRIEGLGAWMEEMEKKVERDVKVYETEEMLNTMRTEYAELMASKGKEVDEVTSQGRHLMTLSGDVRASAIQQRLQTLEDRWLCLQKTLESRRQKVQTTVDSLALVDQKLQDLNRWLSDTEQTLSSPIVYRQFDMQEVHQLLQHSQSVQEDIEGHSGEVQSVLTLCRTLMDEPDTCTTPTEMTTLQEAHHTLNTRWQQIAHLSTDRTTRLQKTGELWEQFLGDWEDFNHWLTAMEAEVDQASKDMPAAVTKEDIRKYETLQTRLHDRLPDLESLNAQHQRLLREGRADGQGTVRQRTQTVNARWDALQQKITELLQALRRSAGAYEDLMSTQRSVVTWLREVDLQVTKVEEHQPPEEDLGDRLKEIQRLEEELVTEVYRLDNVKDGAAVVLLQMSDEGGGRVKTEVQEMEKLYGQVKEHARTCHLRLLELMAAKEDESLKLPQAVVSPMPRPPSQELTPAPETPSIPEPAESEAAASEHGVKVDVLLDQLSEAVSDANHSLGEAEQVVEASASSDGVLGEAQSQSLLDCRNKVDRVKKLYQLLLREAGTAAFPVAERQVTNVSKRWERLQSRVAKRRLQVSERQHGVSKFSADVESLMSWLEEAEALQASHHPLPTDLLQLEVLIRQNRDFLAQLEEKNPRFQSIQLLSRNHIDPGTAEGRQLQARVDELERRWNGVTERADDTQQALQRALLQCQDFHHSLHDHLLSLEGMEARVQQCEPVVLTDDAHVLRDKLGKFKAIHRELTEKQPAVLALRETVDQLLVKNESTEMTAARDRMFVISNRLQALLQKTAGYIRSLESKLGVKSSAAAWREGRLPPVVHPSPYSRIWTPFTYLRKLLFGEKPLSVVPADETGQC